MKPKYKLVKEPPSIGHIVEPMYRIKAVAGVPERGIKRGMKGGLVTGPEVLSQLGTCWIDSEAVVLHGTVTDHAVVRENAFLVRCNVGGEADVSGSAQIRYAIINGRAEVKDRAKISGTIDDYVLIGDDVKISGNVNIVCSHIKNHSTISGHSHVEHSQIIGASNIQTSKHVKNSKLVAVDVNDSAEVVETTAKNSTLSNYSKVSDSNLTDSSLRNDAQVTRGTLVRTTIEQKASVYDSQLTDCVISGIEMITEQEKSGLVVGAEGWQIYLRKSRERVMGVMHSKVRSTVRTLPVVPEPKENIHLKALESIEKQYEEYTTDIINLLTFPVMTDMTDEHTRTLVKCLKKARRYADANDELKLADSVDELEDAFLIAESNARKIRDGKLDSKHQKKLKDAQQMFVLALDPASEEHEKRASFRAGMSNIRGIVDVSDKAVSVLQERIGLKELNA